MRQIILSLLLAISSIHLYSQDAMPDKTEFLDLICMDCDLSAKISLKTVLDCTTKNLELQLEIEGAYDEIKWEGNTPLPVGLTGTVPKNSGIYKAIVTKGEACIATAIFDTNLEDGKLMEQFFKDNCFIGIPVGYDFAGGPGLRNNLGTARNNDLIVTIEGIEGEVRVQDIFDVGGFNTTFFSTECIGFSEGLLAYENGTAWAHIVPDNEADEDDLPTLYLGIKGGNSNTFGEQLTDAYFDFFEIHKSDKTADALSAPITYTCGSGQFLGSKFGEQWITYLLSILECENYDPKEVGKGIVPFCLWEKAPEPFDFYGVDDIPFTAGIVDGGYQMIQDVGELITLLKKLADFSIALGNYLPCHLIGLDEEFYQHLENKLPAPSELDKIRRLLNNALSYTNFDCEASFTTINKVEETLTKIYAFISDWEKVMMAYAAIQEKLSAYYKEITTCNDLITCNNARYEHGKLAINIASIVVGVGVEDALFKSFTYLAKIIDNIPIHQLSDFFTFIATKTNKLKRLSPAQKVIFEDASGVLPPSAWGKLVDDAELLEVWKRLRNKGCVILVGRNTLTECEKLLVDVFGNKRPDLIKDFEIDARVDDFWHSMVNNPNYLDTWESVLKEGIDDVIRTNPEYLEVINRFPFHHNNTKLTEFLKRASRSDFEHIYSGKLVSVISDDQNAKRLSQQYGGQPEVRFDTDPSGKEFDVITESLIIEHKGFNTTRPGSFGGNTITKTKIQFEACIATNRNLILHVDGPIDNNFLSTFDEIRIDYSDVKFRFFHDDVLVLSNF